MDSPFKFITNHLRNVFFVLTCIGTICIGIPQLHAMGEEGKGKDLQKEKGKNKTETKNHPKANQSPQNYKRPSYRSPEYSPYHAGEAKGYEKGAQNTAVPAAAAASSINNANEQQQFMLEQEQLQQQQQQFQQQQPPQH